MKQLQPNKLPKPTTLLTTFVLILLQPTSHAAIGLSAANPPALELLANGMGTLYKPHTDLYRCNIGLPYIDRTNCPASLTVADGKLNTTSMVLSAGTMYEITGNVTDRYGRKIGIDVGKTINTELVFQQVADAPPDTGVIYTKNHETAFVRIFINSDEPNGTRNSFTVKFIPMLYDPNNTDYENILPGNPYTQTFEYVVHNRKVYPIDYAYNPCSTDKNEITINHGTVSPKESNNNTALSNINITCENEVSAIFSINNTTSNDPKTTIQLQPDGNTSLAMAVAGDEQWGTRIEKTLPTGTSTVNVRSTLSRNNEPGIKSGHAVLSMTFN
ncbi:hypothetical protein CWV00_25925 [Salmonella enterica]|nr:hypothetical protein [Salmonella enterica]